MRDLLERPHLLAEPHVGAVLEPLLGAEVDERLPLDPRVAGDVVDVLLGVGRGDLAADLLEALDDPHRRVAVPGVVGGGEPGRARPRGSLMSTTAVVSHGGQC